MHQTPARYATGLFTTLWRTVAVGFCCLSWLFAGNRLQAQTVVSVGAGAYADGIPAVWQYAGGFYSMTPQQVVNDYTNLHIAATVTNRPIPSNKWWTDTLVGDRSYQPAANAPRVLQQDPFGGQLWAYPAMLAPNSAGFNLYFPNAWTPLGSNPAVPQGPFMAGPALPITGYVAPTVGANDILIADFDETTYPPNWAVTGTAFGTGPVTGGTWSGELPVVQGFIGPACVNSYYGSSDTPTGTLTSPLFTIQKHYLSVLVAGGSDTNNTAVKLLIGTNVIYAASGQEDGTMRWTTWDVSAYLGQTNAKIQIVDNKTCCWGFIACSWIVASDNGTNPAARYTSTYTPVNAQVTDWSDWGVRFGLPDNLGNRMDLTLARGVPFVWTTCTGVSPQIGCAGATLYDANGAVIVTSSGGFTNSAFAFDWQGRSFGIFAPSNTVFTVNSRYVQATLAGTNNYLIYGLLPAHTNLAEFAQHAYAEVTNTTYGWSYGITNGSVVTTWNLATSSLQNGETNTLQGWLPHHYRTTSNSLAFKPYTYLTPRGLMRVAAGNQFQIGFNFHGIAPMLPAPHTNGLPDDYVASRMTNYLNAFAAGNPFFVGDTYGQGKELGLAAQYLSFAAQMGLTNQANQLANSISNILATWYTATPGGSNNLFARYDNWRALIGFPPGYGSEAFNDNHFHYGYFMVANALLGMQRPAFLTNYGPMIKLVAKEYANWDRSDTNFPFLRTFDPWEGHSWAGGFSSGNGNNQESSSEAMQSWVGLFLTGNELGDSAMTAAGAMGYAVESTAVNEYWQDMYHTNFPASYGKGGAGQVWSGGLVYGTYFTGDPAWIYGIQWVPANHWNNYLTRDSSFANWQLTNMWTERLIASANNLNGFTLADANNAVSQGAYLGNYILGFQVLFDPNDVAVLYDQAYATNAAIATDPTYSGVTYYLTHTLRALGQQDPNYYTSLPTSQVYYNAGTGQRTYVVYNPTATSQTVTVYDAGVPVDTVFVPAGSLVSHIAGSVAPTNTPSLSLQAGAQVAWPTVSGDTYQPQVTTGGAWTALTAASAGTGSSNQLFDATYVPEKNYRVLQTAPVGGTSLVVNGGFETGTGTNASGWSTGGSQPAIRTSQAAHSGAYSMEIYVTNSSNTPNTSSFNENVAGAGGSAVVPGTAYNFSFWVEGAANGPSYTQNYGIGWLNSNNAQIAFTGWNGFSTTVGSWTQVSLANLVAPAGAVSVNLQIYGDTGAVTGGYGGSYIDDLSFAPNVVTTVTNTLAPVVTPGVQLIWPTMSGSSYQVQKSSTLSPPNWSSSNPIPGTGGGQVWFDAYGTNSQTYYRLLQTQ